MSRWKGGYELVIVDDEPVECEEMGCNDPAIVDYKFESSLCAYHTDEAHEQDAADMAIKAMKENR